MVEHIERTGEVILVGRYGQIVAALVPVPQRTSLELTGTGLSDAAYEEQPRLEARPEWAELGEVKRAVLRRALEAHPMPFGLEGISFEAKKIGAAVGNLELDKLIERDWGGNRLTPEGLAAARWLSDER